MILILAWAVIMLCVAFGADLGRLFVIREQLRTAQDAAALAGALELEYWIQMEFRREKLHETWLCDEDGYLPGEKPETPSDGDMGAEPPGEGVQPFDPEKCELEEWKPTSPLVVQGPEGERWPQLPADWQAACSGDFRCFPKSLTNARCWLQPRTDESGLKETARSIFERNEVWGDQATREALSIEVEGLDQFRPRHVAVRVEGRLEMQTYLLATIGLDELLVVTPRAATAVPVRRGNAWTAEVSSPGGQLETLKSPCDP